MTDGICRYLLFVVFVLPNGLIVKILHLRQLGVHFIETSFENRLNLSPSDQKLSTVLKFDLALSTSRTDNSLTQRCPHPGQITV